MFTRNLLVSKATEDGNKVAQYDFINMGMVLKGMKLKHLNGIGKYVINLEKVPGGMLNENMIAMQFLQ
jgi:hypothetical protein